jgi:hypothetical protein
MLFLLLKSVKNWVYNILFDNKIADNEMRVMYGWGPDESEKE